MRHDATVLNFGLGFALGEGREGLGEKSEQGEESLKDEPFRCAEHPHDTARCAADAKHAVVLERILFAWPEIRSLLHLSAKQAAATLRTKPHRPKPFAE